MSRDSSRVPGATDGAGQDYTPGMDGHDKGKEPATPQPPSWADRLRERAEARTSSAPPAATPPDPRRLPASVPPSWHGQGGCASASWAPWRLPAPSPAPAQAAGRALLWPPVTLQPAAAWTGTLPVSVPATLSGVLTNVLSIGTPDGTDVYTLTTLAYSSALTVSQAVEPGLVVAGRPLTYTLRITNLGNVDLHAVVLDYLPAPITPSLPVAWWLATIPATETPGSPPAGQGAAPGVWSATVTVTPTDDYATANLTDTMVNYVEVVTFEGDWLVHTHTYPAP